jgi:energy-coupling factor transporter ATP-binding protein EcfA2
MAPRISIENLGYRYFAGGNPVFSGFSLEVPSGSCCAILGPTGAGKTTLLEILSGVAGAQCKTSAAEGSIKIGEDRYDPIPQRTLFPKVGLVLQDPDVQISGVRDTVAAEVSFTLEQLSISPSERNTRTQRMLVSLGLSPLAGRNPIEVSGGERQRIALASILVADPTLLLLDEPANGLDSRSQHILKNILRIRKKESTIILTDYSIDFALELADLFVVLSAGRMVFQGTATKFFRELDSLHDLLPLAYWSDLRGRHSKTRVRLPV